MLLIVGIIGEIRLLLRKSRRCAIFAHAEIGPLMLDHRRLAAPFTA